MSIIFLCPKQFQVDLCCKWLTTPEIAFLDNVVCCKQFREIFLNLFNIPVFILNGTSPNRSSLCSPSYINWLNVRNCSILIFCFDDQSCDVSLLYNKKVLGTVEWLKTISPTQVDNVLAVSQLCVKLKVLSISGESLLTTESIMMLVIKNQNILHFELNRSVTTGKAVLMCIVQMGTPTNTINLARGSGDITDVTLDFMMKMCAFRESLLILDIREAKLSEDTVRRLLVCFPSLKRVNVCGCASLPSDILSSLVGRQSLIFFRCSNFVFDRERNKVSKLQVSILDNIELDKTLQMCLKYVDFGLKVVLDLCTLTRMYDVAVDINLETYQNFTQILHLASDVEFANNTNKVVYKSQTRTLDLTIHHSNSIASTSLQSGIEILSLFANYDVNLIVDCQYAIPHARMQYLCQYIGNVSKLTIVGFIVPESIINTSQLSTIAKSCPKLKHLIVKNNTITSASLCGFLKHCHALQSVDIAQTKDLDGSFLSLVCFYNVPLLTKLSIGVCSAQQTKILTETVQNLPNIEISCTFNSAARTLSMNSLKEQATKNECIVC